MTATSQNTPRWRTRTSVSGQCLRAWARMRSVTASLVGWSGRGPALLAMGCPCRELRTRRVCAACRPIGEALMPLTVPPSLLIVVEVLRPCFTAPWFATMSSLVTGALSASGPRTVTGMWQAAGLAGRVHWSRAHRFFSRAVWDPDRVGLALARAVVASLAPGGAAVTVAVDDTLFHRYGRKVHGAKYQHDGSARGRDGIGRGNCFVIVGVVAAVPFLARQVCLPALFRLHIPKTSASKTEQARSMVDLLARPCPGAPSTWWRRPASADRPGAACPPASLHHPPGRQRGPAPTRTRRTGRRGHPAWKGERLGSAAEIAAAATWRRTRVTRYGTTETVDLAVITCLWWGSLHRTPIRVVLVRGTSQARPYTLAPATTDLASTGGQIVARYASRWSSNSRSRTARTSWAPATPKAGCPPPSSALLPWDGRT